MLVRIDKDIENIQQAIADAITRIDTIHIEYSQAIAEAVQQQILLTVFKFCTQKCPDAFLALSLSARQNLQEALRQRIKSLCEQMQKTLEECDRDSRTNQENLDTLLSKLLNESMEKLNQLLVEHKVLNPEETNAKDEKSAQMSIRLAEIEFTDRKVMSHRGELRVLSARLAHLHNELEKKYQQKTIAEAELAWRSAWTE
jgi:chromosome segregation ATPase